MEATNELLQIAGEISPTSWTAPSTLSFEQWQEVGRKFQQVSGSVRWWVGDWLNDGERRYGETYTQAIEVTGNKLQYLKDCKWVAAAVEKSLREDVLSWTHHKYVAKLDRVAMVTLLSYAAEHELSSRELLDAVREYQARQGGSFIEEDDVDEEPPFCNDALYAPSTEFESDFTLSRNMAAPEIAATLQRLKPEVLREVAKLLHEFLKLPIDNGSQLWYDSGTKYG